MNWNTVTLGEKLPSEPGVYRIRLEDGNSVVNGIPRLGGRDPENILSIGETGDLHERIKSFKRGRESGSEHSEARTLWLVENFSEELGNSEIVVDYKAVKSKEKAQEIEVEKLREYFKQYLEVPPLNARLEGRKSWKKELDKR